jgi:GNAT superfamily N-acetyltransferase
MSSSLPEGFTLRRSSEADAPAVAALMREVERPLGGDADTSVDDVLHYWRRHEGDHLAWIVKRRNRVTATLDVISEGDRAEADIYALPAAHDEGVTAALIDLAEARAREWGKRHILTGILSNDSQLVSLLEGAGYEPVRHFYRMTIHLDAPPPKPQWPEGMSLRPFDLERDGRAVHAADVEAFSEEWGHRSQTYEQWHERTLKRSGYDPSLWIVVRDGDEVAAVTICDTKRFGMGWIANVSVRPAWRRRGLGLAMLYEAFRRFHERGERLVGLGVDAQNPTGATRLYERAGMSIAWQATVYEKELA